jgi:hypothetical protein
LGCCIRPERNIFADKTFVDIHHGKETLNATPDGRIVPANNIGVVRT